MIWKTHQVTPFPIHPGQIGSKTLMFLSAFSDVEFKNMLWLEWFTHSHQGLRRS